jgi:L-ascorbate metabolism protein UlaG (beta-lactamase superfamily)
VKNIVKMLSGVIVIFCLNAVWAGETDKIDFIPISHASFVILADNAAIYVDPTGGVKNYEKIKAPDIILITHTHSDHFNKKLIGDLKKEKTVVIGTKTAIKELSYGKALNNGESGMVGTIEIDAVPAYNTTPERMQYHPKGEGNGYYIVTSLRKRIYISGDTEDTPEMRGLPGVDFAFVCMNLPFTMSVEQAASGVLAFKPKVVFPCHYRQGNGFADINKFKQLVSQDKNIEVKLLK